MYLNTDHLMKCVATLESSLQHLQAVDPESIEYQVFRNAAIKGFELSLETAGKLLRKALKSYVGDPKIIDVLTFKEILRGAAKHGLMQVDAVERWFKYRDNRNSTAHDYGAAFAEETLKLIPDFLRDVVILQAALQHKFGQ